MNATKFLHTIYHIGLTAAFAIVGFFSVAQTVDSSTIALETVQFTNADRNELTFIVDSQWRELFSFFEENSESEIEVEDFIDDFCVSTSIFFSTFDLVEIHSSLFSKAKFTSIEFPPLYQLYCNWKLHLFI
uniref:hypothetical protein n=1 Tax=Flavobacterium sp. TaxID=239 RepID=UPI00404978EA